MLNHHRALALSFALMTAGAWMSVQAVASPETQPAPQVQPAPSIRVMPPADTSHVDADFATSSGTASATTQAPAETKSEMINRDAVDSQAQRPVSKKMKKKKHASDTPAK